MASGAGAIVDESSLSTHLTQIFSSPLVPDDFARLPKRRRESESSTSRSFTIDQHYSPNPSAKSARISPGLDQSLSLLPGAQAPEGDRRRREKSNSPRTSTEDIGHEALILLMSGATSTMSRPSDAPQLAPTATMEPTSKTTSTTIPVPHDTGERPEEHLEDPPQTSPESTAGIAGAPVTDSPAAMDIDDKTEILVSQQVSSQEERQQPASLSYPGSLQSSGSLTETPTRGMSFPVPSHNQSPPPSTGGKKHKCPYCNTEFTRHHNLKSHLLTHSHTKPFECTECQMRFRRLHDLKRHGKLHTGEKPHVCPKCDRKFARGDALARHSKGAGGCAGRRSSIGSFANGDELDGVLGEGDETVMSGIAYDNGGEEELRRQGLSGMNAQHSPSGQGDQYTSAHARTYSQSGGRGASSGLYPPNMSQAQAAGAVAPNVPNHVPGSHIANAGIGQVQVTGGGAGVYSQTSASDMKSASPGFNGHESGGIGGQRSPSSTQQQQQQQQQMGRRQPEVQSPHSHGGQPKSKPPTLSHTGFQSSNATGISHGRTPSGATLSSDSGNMFAQSDPSVWAYIQTLEDKLKTLSERVSSLDDEVAGLKKQVENQDVVAAG